MGHVSYTITDELSDEAALLELGKRFAAVRIQQRFTQAQLGEMANVSLNTIKRFESGQSIDLRNFIRVLRGLGRSAALNVVLPEVGPSPIDLLRLAGKRRKRVRPSNTSLQPVAKASWKWGDER